MFHSANTMSQDSENYIMRHVCNYTKRTKVFAHPYISIIIVIKWVYLWIRIRAKNAIYCISDIIFEFYAFELPSIIAFYR